MSLELVAAILIPWAVLCFAGSRFVEMPADFQHPSELAPEGCYDGDDA